MGVLVQLSNTLAVLVVGVLVWFYLRGRFEQVDRRFEQVDRRFEQVDRRFEQVDHRFEQVDRRFERLEHELRREIADLREEGNRRFELLMTEINAVRSDITRLAIALGVQPRPEANPA